MKERPILFSGEMVRAILEGRKTQTRRIVKDKRVLIHSKCSVHWCKDGEALFDNPGWHDSKRLKCPFGKPGDRLWVRETFWCINDSEAQDYAPSMDCGSLLNLGPDYAEIDFCATPECFDPPKPKYKQTINLWTGEPAPGYWFLNPPENWDSTDKSHREKGQWDFIPWQYFTKHPSIHMPRWASRITLEITNVRVERLLSISKKDAIAEGIQELPSRRGYYDPVAPDAISIGHYFEDPRDAFGSLWEKFNGSESWDSNPWVWVIEFEKN